MFGVNIKREQRRQATDITGISSLKLLKGKQIWGEYGNWKVNVTCNYHEYLTSANLTDLKSLKGKQIWGIREIRLFSFRAGLD